MPKEQQELGVLIAGLEGLAYIRYVLLVILFR
jgi:hypothetical protein